MRDPTDLGHFESAKSALARAQEINASMQAERERLSDAINSAVCLVMILIMSASFYFFGFPEHKRLYEVRQEQVVVR